MAGATAANLQLCVITVRLILSAVRVRRRLLTGLPLAIACRPCGAQSGADQTEAAGGRVSNSNTASLLGGVAPARMLRQAATSLLKVSGRKKKPITRVAHAMAMGYQSP